MNRFVFSVLIVLSASGFTALLQTQTGDLVSADTYHRGRMLYSDNFDRGMDNWVAETVNSARSGIAIDNERLVIDVDHGATVWLNKKLSGNILIEYQRSVIMNNGHNDRLSDLNQFWMATDPRREDLFTRSGIFSEYDSLSLYYAGIGGNSNTTSRFRKYSGDGRRTLIADLQDEEHLLQPNKNYLIQIVVYNGKTQFFVDGICYFTFTDENPLTEGYFGFRTVQSHQQIDNLRIFALK